jgi:hypothetical protein
MTDGDVRKVRVAKLEVVLSSRAAIPRDVAGYEVTLSDGTAFHVLGPDVPPHLTPGREVEVEVVARVREPGSEWAPVALKRVAEASMADALRARGRADVEEIFATVVGDMAEELGWRLSVGRAGA